MANAKPGEKPSDGSLMQTAIAFVVAGLIGGGVGVFQGLQVKAPEAIKPELAKAEFGKPDSGKATEKKTPIGEMGTLDVPPIVTNLAAPADVWVRVEGSILFEGKTLPKGEALVAQISGDILAFMRTQTLQEIQGVAGLQHLRQDLNERVATRTDGKVRQFIIKSLVVQ